VGSNPTLSAKRIAESTPPSMNDQVIEFLRNSARSQKWIDELILFGSRSRGDNHDRSDYDIAVKGDFSQNWPTWALWIAENAPTLCGIDLVQYNEGMSVSLKQAVDTDGKTIYEK
jgi:predicted nucleotidyltransferase